MPALFIRVKDPQTKHEFDRREDDPAVVSGRFVRVKDDRYPPSPIARRPKHYTKLAGRAASRETAPQDAASEAPEKENHNG